MLLRDALGVAAPLLAIAALVFGPGTSLVAARRQRNPALWLAFGAVLGPIALLLVVLAPPARCRSCGEPTNGFASDCQTCGADVRLRRAAHPAQEGPVVPVALSEPAPDVALAPPTVTRRRRSSVSRVSDPEPAPDAGRDDLPVRLAAVGAQRPRLVPDPSPAPTFLPEAARNRLDLTMIAIGVHVRGSESLLAGSRYLVARTHDRLIVVGPIGPSDHHVELDLPLAGLEVDVIADRLVLSGRDPAESGRRFILAFISVVPLAARAVDDALLEHRGGEANAIGSS